MLRLRAGLFLGPALLLLLGAIPARAHVGTGVVVDAEGRVYFTDPLRNRLWRLERHARRWPRAPRRRHTLCLRPPPLARSARRRPGGGLCLSRAGARRPLDG